CCVYRGRVTALMASHLASAHRWCNTILIAFLDGVCIAMPPSDISSSDQPTQPTESVPKGVDSPMRVHHRLPALRTRPPTGLLAWHSTVGYMSQHHSADAQLTIRVIPRERRLSWTASLAWGYHRETVEERSTLAAALADLWTIVEQNVVVFLHEADQVISPAHYDQAEWLDIPTQEIFQR